MLASVFFRYTPGFVHAKVYVSDGQQAVVGTINTDYRSLYQNFEDGVYLYKNLEVIKIEQDFEKTQALSEEVALESLSKNAYSTSSRWLSLFPDWTIDVKKEKSYGYKNSFETVRRTG